MIEDIKSEIVVKTLKGLEPVLCKELEALGAEDIQIRNRAVICKGDKRMLYAINFRCRTALRVLLPIHHFEARSPDEVYEQLKAVDWDKYMGVKDTFSVDAVVFSDDFRHSKFVAYRTKDAIADYFMERQGKRPSVSVTSPALRFNMHISQYKCTLSLDSSGDSLHKRGWREATTEAPLSEVLAAGMILHSGWDGKTDFYDPMCGSGTLLIEAALIALNIAPGSYRRSFAFEKWRDFDADLLQELYEDESYERTFEHTIYGSDISPQSIAVAEKNIKAAGLSKYIKLKTQAVDEARPVGEKGMMITNPPYDERLKVVNTSTLYGTIGRTIKHQFAGCEVWVLAYRKEDLFALGLKPSKKLEVKNGDLDCFLWQYEVFSGKRAEHKERVGKQGAYKSDERQRKTTRPVKNSSFKAGQGRLLSSEKPGNRQEKKSYKGGKTKKEAYGEKKKGRIVREGEATVRSPFKNRSTAGANTEKDSGVKKIMRPRRPKA